MSVGGAEESRPPVVGGAESSRPPAVAGGGTASASASASTSASASASAGASVAAIPASARYYVRLGEVHSIDARIVGSLLQPAREHLAGAVGSFAGVAVAPTGESRSDGAERIRARGLVGVMLECSVVRVDVGPQGTRAAVSLVVADLANADIVATMQGGALASGTTGELADRAAIQGAIDSALRGLPRLLDTLALR